MKTWWEREFDYTEYKFRKLNRHGDGQEPVLVPPWPEPDQNAPAAAARDEQAGRDRSRSRSREPQPRPPPVEEDQEDLPDQRDEDVEMADN